MKDLELLANHYTRGDLLSAILAGVEKLGKTPETVTIDDLAPVDEFHIGGRVATRAFLDQLSIAADEHVLDVGCGIGGASRYAAKEYGCRVAGVDLTNEYVETGTALCRWLGQESRISLVQGNVFDLSVPDAAFDKAFMLHVGMNISDKVALAKEIRRVLKPGAVFGIYDIMQIDDKPLSFPVPWATVPEASFLASPEDYKRALAAAGFEIVNERNRRDFAIEFFEGLKAQSAATAGPPPLGLHVIMGVAAPTKIQNMVSNVAQGSIAPVELIARKA